MELTLFRDYGQMQILILARYNHYPKKMNTEISLEFGEQCLIYLAHFSRGKITLVKVYILQVLSVMIMLKHRKDGQNGSFQAMNIFMLNVKMKILFHRYLDTCTKIISH